MLDDPVRFTGPEQEAVDPSSLETIAIGLFAPDATDPVGRALSEGTELALETANAEGGLAGVPFRLVRRWAEDPWNAGSKEVVRLAYRDRVWAVIGSRDGRSTHVAQQVVTKARLPLVSPVAADPSLTHVRIPWIFRLCPDDAAQARVLVLQGLRDQNLHRVGLLTGTDHDSRLAEAELLREMERHGVAPAFHRHVGSDESNGTDLADQIRPFRPDGLVLRVPPSAAVRTLVSLRDGGIDCPVFLPWIPGLALADARAAYAGELAAVLPFDPARSEFREFARVYAERFGHEASASATFAYDAAMLVVRSLLQAGLTRTGLRHVLSETTNRKGVTGPITWDAGGGNPGRPVLVALRPGPS
jgi:branched-chain amino acid transport system substrate-binding protein